MNRRQFLVASSGAAPLAFLAACSKEIPRTDFGLAYSAGKEFAHPANGSMTISVQQIGTLNMPSGQLHAFEPQITFDGDPLPKPVQPGKYPVVLSIGTANKKREDQRVACAKVQLSAETATKWEEVDTRRFDKGTFGFADEETVKNVRQREALETKAFMENLRVEMQRNHIANWDWADISVNDMKTLNIVSFTTGWGPGEYKTYFGYTDSDKLVEVVTDFMVLTA